jgi:hypothetical protein
MPVIPATQEVEVGKIVVQGQPGQKVKETLSQINNLGMVVPACHPNLVRVHK